MSLIVRIVLIFALCSLSGCVAMLWPHTEQVVPAVTGTVLRNGEPVSGASVFIVASLRANACTTSKYKAVTDKSGHFAIGGDSDLHLFVVMGDRLDSWGICIEESGSRIPALQSHGIGYPPTAVTVVCDLGRSENICQGA